jgi:hypothetical protein
VSITSPNMTSESRPTARAPAHAEMTAKAAAARPAAPLAAARRRRRYRGRGGGSSIAARAEGGTDPGRTLPGRARARASDDGTDRRAEFDAI